MTATWEIRQGDALSVLQGMESGSVQCVVTSPPYYGLRSYSGGDAEIGLEQTPSEYVAKLVAVFEEVRRVLRDDGVLWLVIGDSYAGTNATARPAKNSTLAWATSKYLGPERNLDPSAQRLSIPAGYKAKDLLGIPWRVAFALQDAGWWLRSDCIWAKPSAMPESVTDRPTRSHEYVFLLTKAARYFYDSAAIREPEARTWNGATTTGQRWRTGIAEGKILGGPTGTPVNSGLLGSESHTMGRNRRTVWTISPEPLGTVTEYADGTGTAYDHFAAYPTKLVEPCVLAGTSERGCCRGCGAPWKRIVETSRGAMPAERGGKNYGKNAQGTSESSALRKVGGADWHEYAGTSQTLGWQPSCKCDAGDPVPCVVLDPFLGSGTTGIVALRLGRRFVGIELNESYCELARRRIIDDAPMLNTLAEAGA